MTNPTTRSALMASGATMIAEVDSLPLEAEARAETVPVDAWAKAAALLS